MKNYLYQSINNSATIYDDMLLTTVEIIGIDPLDSIGPESSYFLLNSLIDNRIILMQVD